MCRKWIYLSLGFMLVLSWQSQLFSQWSWNNRVRVEGDGVFMGGAGMAFINGESYFVFNLRTELAFGNWGIGIDVPLRFNTENGQLRKGDWDGTYDYFRALRYIRYGIKRRTPVYSRLGTLDGARLGHGFIMNYYTNEAQYDNRKIGVEFDLKFRTWGMESVVSDVSQFDIWGGRFYVVPMRNMSQLWLLKKLTFGATYVTDRDPDQLNTTDDAVSVFGLDVELPLLQTGPFYSLLYADHAKIADFGSGQAVGLELGLLRLAGLLTVQAKIERRFLGKQFLPAYFDPFYEVERFRNIQPAPVRKTDLLAQRTASQRGYYGELFGHVLGIIKLLGTFDKTDNVPKSGRLHLGAMLSKPIARFSARAMYDKTAIGNLGDVFSLDERSILRAGFGYQINKYLFLFTDYIWTYKVNQKTGQLESQRRVEPQLTFVMPF